MPKYAHHKYTYEKPYGYPRHNWSLIGQHGGLRFHATTMPNHGPSCGLEIHRFSGEGAPSHTPCHLLGAPCWHDGTSLYANETLWPLIEPFFEAGAHDAIFKLLEAEATRFMEAKINE